MLKRLSILLFTLLFPVYGIIFSIDKHATAQSINDYFDTATIEKTTKEFYEKICFGHGGVNCSAMNADASVVCNDGTIDVSLSTIYKVPQCQETLKNLAKEQSDFMAETGCFPPSELRCYSKESYNNLFKILYTAGLAKSELGKSELSQCLKQIGEYQEEKINYQQCLIKNGRPQFEPSGKFVLPILKAAFCPLFFGNSSYNSGADLCICDAGYFMDNELCVPADKICQNRYGQQSYAKNGNCISSFVATPKIVISKPSPQSTGRPLIYPETTPSNYDQYNYPDIIPEPVLIEEKLKESEPGFLEKIFAPLISGIKKMLRLF